MRFCLPWVAVCLLLWTPPVATAQQPEKKPEAGSAVKVGDRTLAQWLADIGSKDRSKAETAMNTLPFFGAEGDAKGLPVILAELKKHGTGAHLDTSTRETAAFMVGDILVRMEKPEPRVFDEAIAALRRLLGDGQSIVKVRAAEALSRVGARAKAAVPDLLTAAADKDTWGVRQAALIALRAVAVPGKDGPDPAVVKAFCSAVGDDVFLVRLAGTQGLLWLGSPSAATRDEMVTALNGAARDTEPVVQIPAYVALIRIKAKGWEAHLGALGKFLANDDPLLRANAAEALGHVGPEAQSQVPRLIEALKDKDHRVIAPSIWALGQLGRAAAQAIAHLQAFAADAERPANLRKMAAEAVDAIQGKKK